MTKFLVQDAPREDTLLDNPTEVEGMETLALQGHLFRALLRSMPLATTLIVMAAHMAYADRNTVSSRSSAHLAILLEKEPYKSPEGLEKLESLNPIFRKKARDVISILEKKGWPIRVVWGKRTKAENDNLVRKGLASNDSRHLYCEAVDVIYNYGPESYSSDHGHPYYTDLREAVNSVGGLRWGGSFTDRWDPTHFEMFPFGDGCPK